MGLMTLTISVIYIASYPTIYPAPKQNVSRISVEVNEIFLTCQKPQPKILNKWNRSSSRTQLASPEEDACLPSAQTEPAQLLGAAAAGQPPQHVQYLLSIGDKPRCPGHSCHVANTQRSELRVPLQPMSSRG